MPKLKVRLACPEGHEGLTLRCVVDYPAMLSADGRSIEPDLSKHDLQEVGETLGVDGGCWCEECDEWYRAAACIDRQ
jgi:hypothetical protein